MAKAPTTLPTPGFDLKKILRGQQQYVFVQGTDAYAAYKNGPMTLDDGTTKMEAEVRTKRIGPLFELMRDYGRESIYAGGQMYDPGSVFDTLEAASMSIDPRALYTVVGVVVSQQAAIA